jgi:hypothetical protein
MEEYLFDLRGYIVVRNALSREHVRALNAAIDAILALEPPLAAGEWYGYVHAHSFGGKDGINLQQIYEGGEPFESLIDHPSWIEKVKHFVGGAGTFDYLHGPLFIDENFANIRGPGEAIGLHSGGHQPVKRCQFRFHGGQFSCGQVNVLMALTDIGAGDGATMVIPGSHKSNFPHPHSEKHAIKAGQATSVDDVEGAIEVQMQAGDALVFVDAIAHGSAARTNGGERRIVVYRYGPSWATFRHPYAVSEALLSRLTPARRQIVRPQTPVRRQPNRLVDILDPAGSQEIRREAGIGG